ncbi:MAG TPA: [Fe-Fe] hydrogenase large subunit C-terminal domain-containing protein [Syntrophorhabdaceae bacterium]|nr:[Fe-Fe] hydrogenase large subunit C-terminal domain-containing protein [Syntrophorhabdaceae bacterium]HOL05681.1 [Fe-Fe] hydrogenase large subunit C-terminal domain-containing protein [Syntrophorhabdaceae bacterium]HON85319.1 [Fe-Fe] hydrogenase large subunit C-terminal domain-containing protein [Syntrophorhabdaceae bacterium]HOT41639.1 [Fe-Fe] hydrogenase large subunit C-terminal domain-containing protein [Syntrophorhabdaceae bacterium]HPC67147.1 [Fe-Fe] hydrogenase large subunit C-terminal
MSEYFHSVTLDFEKCKGCTNCIKKCPMEAIRVHDGKATIMQERCIDCGECIRCCPNHAKTAVTDTLDILSEYKYRIALPAPSFFGQFKELENADCVLHGLLSIGFDDVFEVALAAEIVGFLVHQYIKDNKVKKPVFSSACPAVLRLMQIKFPDLLEQIAPILTPMEVAARLAKEEAVRKTGIDYEDIGAFFISPCPAKVTEMRNPMTTKHSAVNGVIGVQLIYKDIIKYIIKEKTQKDPSRLQKATKLGMAWGYVTGESKNVDASTTLAVSGIHNVISLLEEIERGELKNVDFIELQACIGGCVGGPLNIHNLFVGRVRLRELIKKCGSKPSYYTDEELLRFYTQGHYASTEPVQPKAIMHLDEDMSKAIQKMERLDQITNELPGLDCGACGSPSCRALAEDIIRGIAFETDCVIKLREKVKTLAEEILDLARIVPPVMADTSKKTGEK